MKSLIVPALCTLTVLTSTGTAAAQIDRSIATIPFGFNIGNAHLPAGAYVISQTWNKTVLAQSNEKHLERISGDESSRPEPRGRIFFKKYGSHYFLQAILSCSGSIHVSLPTSATEKKIQAQETKLDGGEPVFVATN